MKPRPGRSARAAAAALGLVLVNGSARAGGPEAPHLGACGLDAGGFQLPGSDGCLRLSGFVAADVSAWHGPPAALAIGLAPGGPRSGDLGRSTIGTDARLSADVRLPTELGPARVYVSLRARHGGLSAAH